MATFAIDLISGKVFLFVPDIGGSSGGTTGITSGSTYPEVDYYSDLPSPASSYNGKTYLVRYPEGTYVKDRKESGLYHSNGGSVWYRLGDIPSFFDSSNFQIFDSVDNTKGIEFITSSITGNTFRQYTWQDKNGTVALLQDLDVKVDLSLFNSYTGTTAPNTYLKLNQSTPQSVTGGTPKFDAINFNTGYTKTGSESVGTRFWDSENHTTSVRLENGITLQDGQEIHIYGRNISSNIIRNGQPVSVTAATGQWTAFNRVDITNPAAYAFIGLATQEIGINDFGYVTINGVVREINTDHLIEGKPVYIDITGGTTSIFPTVPNYIINVGVVERKHGNDGRINVIKSIVPKLEDLSDVNGTALTTTGQVPIWNNTSKFFDFNYNINNYVTNNTFTGYSASTEFRLLGIENKVSGITNISGSTHISSGISYNRTYVNNVNYTPKKTDTIIGISTSTNGVNINLPSINSIGEVFWTFKDEGFNAANNSIIFSASTGNFIENNEQTLELKTNGGSISIYNNNNNNWFII